ncbi:unnamed protein product [Arabidopsis thaliana]|uniref:Uncharacterized protein n=1 Tax=Arabidopsis thaliana TaxID=3702 RepID=A0A654E9N4_ARATH|nr:unnamed protein product [Arabidopsis thaliana]
MNMSEEEEQCKRNQEAFKRFFEQIPRTAVIGMLSFFLHGQMSKFEKAPSKPLSNAFAFASVGYVVLQVAHGFARAIIVLHLSLSTSSLFSVDLHPLPFSSLPSSTTESTPK